MKVRSYLLVVVFPLLIMTLWCVSLSIAIARGTEVSFKVTGYDPRDLLSGHYLTYRVDYGTESKIGTLPNSQPGCICLSVEPDGLAKGTWAGACEERNQSTCSLFIKGTLEYGSFLAGIERYYFPEVYQESLATVPSDATIKVKITSEGSAYVQAMLVAGEPIEEYARRTQRDKGVR